MDGFNELLLRLRDVHEREVEGWQMKVQELSNKKGCDTKRMEELFTRNQQMKEQQRLLTENIKTLENRLRAGLCDRCTVTQEVAKRRQQEFEVSQMQTFQRITLLVAEMNNLKEENRRLRDEMDNLRAALKGNSDRSSGSSSTATDVKPNSPDLSPSPGPFVTTVTSRAGNQPIDGDVQEQRSEENRQLRGASRSSLLQKPLSLSSFLMPTWKTEPGVACIQERRRQSMDLRPPIPSPVLLFKDSGDKSPGRLPCRPQPIKSSIPWTASEFSKWNLLQASAKANLPHFPTAAPAVVPTGQRSSHLRQSFGSTCHKHDSSQPPSKEPTVLFRLVNLSEHMESESKHQEKSVYPPSKSVETEPRKELRDLSDGPLDLSDRKSKSDQTPAPDSPLDFQSGDRLDSDVKTNVSPQILESSPSPISPSSGLMNRQLDDEPSTDPDHEELKDEVNRKTDSEKKVPALTISLRPVVMLETLNFEEQKDEAASTNGKSSWATSEPASSSEEPGGASGQEDHQGCKRKRASATEESDQDSDTDDPVLETKLRLTEQRKALTGTTISDV